MNWVHELVKTISDIKAIFGLMKCDGMGRNEMVNN